MLIKLVSDKFMKLKELFDIHIFIYKLNIHPSNLLLN
jgi:hypothetical protein